MPYGHLVRTDAEGKTWELVAGGLRNPFGIDFNAAGDLFTFDADMEWDVGLSWYHPTRVLHLIPGGDYGWRRGTGVLPVWSPDTLPSVVDIGLSSPTAIKFATKSNWPEPWRSALLILDWAYGKVHAVHLQRAGPTYRARTEVFLKGRPLNVTGLDFGPDGAMYFTTGGRRTQSGLYRVTWNGPQSGITKSASAQSTPGPLKPATSDLWTRLNDPDHWVRYTARVELESKPVGEWLERACSDSRPFAGLTALLALSRCGESALQPRLVQSVLKFAPQSLTPEQQLIAIRALAVCFIRMGTPDRALKQRVLEPWDRVYPTADSHVNQSLCELLVYLGSSNTVRKTLPLLASAATQEEKFHYLFTLRLATNGWTLPERATYFDWLRRARTEFKGANMLPTALNYIRADAEATLSPGERAALGDVLAELSKPAAPSAAPAARAFVKEWTMKDFEAALRPADRAANLARGQRLFNEIGCAQCHRLGGEGGFIGPDLTAVASRFDRRSLLESIVEPSKVVAEVYRAASITLKSGAIVDGRIVSEDAKAIFVAINPVDPDQRRRVAKTDIAARSVSDVSPMPTGLLNTLTRDEVLDLVAWIESGGAKPN
jgi:putative heme-binding domain-containing protein